MRDFRDAKAMAHTLRAALAARGLKITISQSLELIAETLGVADWNTLAAAIRADATVSRNKAAPLKPQIGDAVAGFGISAEFEATLHRALACADQRRHKYSTLEHLLVALIDDPDASAVMRGCNADLGVLKDRLVGYLDNELNKLVIAHGRALPTAAFQRVVQRAERYAKELGGTLVTGANALVAIFAERESEAAYRLHEQGMSRQGAASFVARDIGS